VRNIDVMRRGFAAWNAGDIDAALELMHPDVEWHTAGLMPDVDDVYRGREGVRRFWADFRAPWEWIELEPHGLTEVGDHVVGAMLFRARGREGIAVELELGQVYTVREGLLALARSYPTPAEAWDAVEREAPA
jgi:ketosteroid isomerase-like protein